MSNLITPKARTVRFWAVGGTGIDLVRDYRETQSLAETDLYGDEQFTYVDTSDSNMHGLESNGIQEVYRVTGIDGGGKDREKVKSKIIPALPEIMMTYNPGDLNIVVGSPSGGTGSGGIPQITKELVKAGHAVAIVLVADHTSTKSSENSILCLTELEQLSQLIGKSIPIHWSTNDRTKTQLDNGAEAKFVMAALSLLASGKHKKLDSSDIRNFLDYTGVTGHKAGLGHLRVTTDVTTWNNIGHIATLAGVMGSELSILADIESDYDAIGYLPEGSNNPYKGDIYYSVTLGMDAIINQLIEIRKMIEMKQKVQVQTASLLGGGSLGGTGISLD